MALVCVLPLTLLDFGQGTSPSVPFSSLISGGDQSVCLKDYSLNGIAGEGLSLGPSTQEAQCADASCYSSSLLSTTQTNEQ